ncbi:hypothetical protein AB0M39_21570, partial [Streptomyces sp. NPDC051907]|uniref:hypothetical protein n=1 Tax=Streptomyces sp. NPDC051907 TaxID=3155284 RepID=UPI00341E0C9F
RGDDHGARDDDPDEYAVRACQLHRGHPRSPPDTQNWAGGLCCLSFTNGEATWRSIRVEPVEAGLLPLNTVAAPTTDSSPTGVSPVRRQGSGIEAGDAV